MLAECKIHRCEGAMRISDDFVQMLNLPLTAPTQEAVFCAPKAFVGNQTLVFPMKFSAKNPSQGKADNR